jgi:hypothetical protein
MGSFSGPVSWTTTFRASQARAAEIGKKLPVVEEVSAEDLRDTEYDMTVGDLLEAETSSLPNTVENRPGPESKGPEKAHLLDR